MKWRILLLIFFSLASNNLFAVVEVQRMDKMDDDPQSTSPTPQQPYPLNVLPKETPAPAPPKASPAAGLPSEESSQPIPDERITLEIKELFARKGIYGREKFGPMNVDIEVSNGVVTLSGRVESREQKDSAVKLAQTVKGVKMVQSQILIDNPK